jgi:amino acid transporter
MLPFARWTKRVNRHTKTPVNAIWVLVIISTLVGLLMFASPIAIYATFSIGGVSQYVAFGLPITLRLFAGDRFKPGKFLDPDVPEQQQKN